MTTRIPVRKAGWDRDRQFVDGDVEMGWSVTLGTVSGIVVRMHMTFLLLLAWIGTILWAQSGPEAAIEGILFIVLLFVCVVLHEFGHAFAARRYGIGTRDITLLPIGGLASLDRMPDDPGQEIVVALAGPAVNVVIAGVLFLAVGGGIDPSGLAKFGEGPVSFVQRLATINLVLAVFNLIPAFPMDGGRVLRALLGFRMPRAQATDIAAKIGQALAVVFAFLGLLGNPFLILIAIFIYFAASAEAYGANMREFARGRAVEDAMITQFEVLPLHATLDEAARLLLATTQQEFPVVSPDARLEGFLTRKSLIEQMGEHVTGADVSAAIERDVPVVKPGTSLEHVVALLEPRTAPAIGVVDKAGDLVGYVTLENLAEFFMVRTAGGLKSPVLQKHDRIGLEGA
jgi:Zn-dependent protease